MIELRWLASNEFEGVKKLQYRETMETAGFGCSVVTGWTEWKDVPCVNEVNDGEE